MKLKFIYFFIVTTIASFSHSISTIAQTNSKEITSPSFLKRTAPKYPRSQVNKGNAGAIEISLMVDEEGRPFDPVVVRSSDNDFDKSAKSAVAKYIYAPAHQDGKAVNSRSRVVIYYEIEGQMNSLTRRFHRWMKKNNPLFLVDDSSSASLEKALKKAGSVARSRCDHSFLALFQNVYETRFGSPENRIESFYFAIMFDDEITPERRCFSDEDEAYLYGGLLRALADSERWGELQYTYQKALSLGLKDVVAPFEAVVSEIKLNQLAVMTTPTKLSMTNGNGLVAELFTTTFTLNISPSQLERISLRCENGFHELAVLEGMQYKKPKELMNCQLLAEIK